ncbi:hypothetical protein PT974_08396 [Cladobotryum mycophilum]|uniref:Uncharacterized protein n=1 Tax=Cladobotryum mycophilum TaxID=491253 RepID=A0ABR0SD91_9HYPO
MDDIASKLCQIEMGFMDDASPPISCQVSEACPTPTRSVFSDATMTSSAPKNVEHHPQEGKTFIIRSHDERKMVIELLNGAPQVESEQAAGAGIAWRCVKRQGWYGFINTVSGAYLGHNARKKLHSKVFHHKADEEFMAERHPDGGYLLLMKQGDGLWQIAIGEDNELVLKEKEGTTWDFIEANNMKVFFDWGEQ